MRKVVRLNDPTTHGGTVVSVTATHFTVGGVAVARVGDKCVCPIHGPGVIIEGDANHKIDGVSVAYDNHTTSCGAKLIATVPNFGRS
jgi:uncharacterized Zn-binding protein involved in type VI secretion